MAAVLCWRPRRSRWRSISGTSPTVTGRASPSSQSHRVTCDARPVHAHPLPASRTSRLAIADLLLLAVTTVMLTAGLWDVLAGHPTQIRWHAISGVLLAGMLVAHALRRRRRLLGSST